MSVSRREMLRFGAAGAGSLLLSSAARSNSLPRIHYRLPPNAGPVTTAPLAGVPARPAVAAAAPGGIDPLLFARAKAALDRRAHWLPRRDLMAVVDFSLSSNEPRFHLVDLMNGRVESHLVAHGRGSDPGHSGFLERFSNDFGSYASSNGAYTTADTYYGKYGLSMKVRGLEPSNCNAEARAIVIHNAWYAEPEMIAEHGKLGRSEGCFAMSRDSQWRVMSRLGTGRMIYADKLA